MALQSILSLAAITAVTAFTLILLRILWILPSINPQPPIPRKSSAKLLIVLGSGGHTAEMLRLLKSLNFEKYTRRTYIISTGDTLSQSKARQFEFDKTGISNDAVRLAKCILTVVLSCGVYSASKKSWTIVDEYADNFTVLSLG
jgi:hypothetical protein